MKIIIINCDFQKIILSKSHMKNIILTLVVAFASHFASAQAPDTSAPKIDTTLLKVYNKNKVKTVQLKTDSLIMKDAKGKPALQVVIYKSKQAAENKTVIVEFTDLTKTLGCISENDLIMVTFSDKSNLELYQSGLYNCKGKSVVHFRGTWGGKDKIELLLKKDVASVLFNSMTTSLEGRFTPSQAKTFRAALKAIDDYSF